MDKRSPALPTWFPYVDLACAIAAGGLWFALPRLGAAPLLVGLAPWAVRLVRTGRPTRRTAFDLPLALFLATAAVGVWAAPDRAAAWSKLWLLVGGLLLFYALANAEALGEVRAWLLTLLSAGVAALFLASHDWDALPAKIDALTRLGKALQAPWPGLVGERLHPNLVGGALAMTLPFALLTAARSWRRRRLLPLVGAHLALAAILFGLVMTTSRGAWLALAGALALAAVWLLAGWLSRGHAERQALLFPMLLAAALAAAVAVAAAWPGGIAAAWNALPGPSSGGSRLDLLQNCLRSVRDYPFIGLGLGNFQMFYSTYVLLLHVGYITHSHNLYLDVALEQGLPALALLGWAWALFFWGAWRGLMAGRDRGPLGAAALSLAVVLLHGLVDDPLYSSRAALLLFVPLAFAVPPRRAAPRPVGRWQLLALPVALLAAMGLVLVARRPLLSLVYSNLGAVHQGQAELSLYRWPDWPIQDAVRRAVDLRRPAAEFERALALDPGNPTANRRLGQIELSLGQYEPALRHLEVAAAAEPSSSTLRQLLGEALIANGRLEEGRALWAGVRRAEGQLDVRIWWYGYIGDAQRQAWMKEAANAR